MKISEPARDIDVVHETDVLVVGSGPGGLAAAIGAARAGVSTTLLERFGCFGGNRDTHAATRNMMCCTVTGQGAGVAAAMSVKHDQALGKLNIGALQTELLHQGVRLQ